MQPLLNEEMVVNSMGIDWNISPCQGAAGVGLLLKEGEFGVTWAQAVPSPTRELGQVGRAGW